MLSPELVTLGSLADDGGGRRETGRLRASPSASTSRASSGTRCGVRRRGVRGADHLRGARRADRPARRRRAHAVVPRRGLRFGVRLAGYRLDRDVSCCTARVPPPTTRGSPGSDPSTIDPVRDAFERFDALVLDDGRGCSADGATPRSAGRDRPVNRCSRIHPAAGWPGRLVRPADLFPYEVRGRRRRSTGSRSPRRRWSFGPGARVGRVRGRLRRSARGPRGRACHHGCDWGQELARQGVWYFPGNRNHPAGGLHRRACPRGRAALLQDALEGDGYRFDGSDLMPDGGQPRLLGRHGRLRRRGARTTWTR
jgi:hypothetical protein